MFFLDSNGKELEKWTSRDASQIAARMKEIADQYTTSSKGRESAAGGTAKKSPFGKPGEATPKEGDDEAVTISWSSDLPEALQAGRKEGKAVVLVVASDGSALDGIVSALQTKRLKSEIEMLVFVKAPFDPESDLCKTLEIRRDPTLLAIDPFAATAKEGILARLLGSRSTAELKEAFKPIAPARYACGECKRAAFRSGLCCGRELTEKRD
jgi:hypothetical protein